MAFCTFDESAALFDSTPVENMFITEYMLRAPGDFVKVYIYALMLCYHSSERMSLTTMAKDLDMTEEEVERAFRYWARDGLCRQVGDNPVCFKLFNLKQLTLTRAQTPSEQLYNRDFTEEVKRKLGGRELSAQEWGMIYDWIDVYELPEEVVIMLLELEMQKSGGRVSISIADKEAREWARSGICTVEDVEKIVVLRRERENNLRKLLKRMGQARTPSYEERDLYTKWRDDWGFTAQQIEEASKLTVSGTPTMAYLDGILKRRVQSTIKKTHAEEARDFKFYREIFQMLGRTGVTPSEEDQKQISGWLAEGFSEEMIKTAASEVHARNLGGNLEYVQEKLQKWKANGLKTIEEVQAARMHVQMLNAQLREVYAALGVEEKRVSAADRKLLYRWMSEMRMSFELILLAAEYAGKSSRRMETVDRILSDWQRAGISTIEAAREEHEAHVRSMPQTGARQSVSARPQDAMLRYTPEQRRETYSAAVLDFDEEDN